MRRWQAQVADAWKDLAQTRTILYDPAWSIIERVLLFIFMILAQTSGVALYLLATPLSASLREARTFRRSLVTSKYYSLVRRGLWSRRRGHREVLLPLEIWTLILQEVIYIPYAFDTTCEEPRSFHLFVQKQRYRAPAMMKEESEISRLCRELRLVCRAWNELLSLSQLASPWLCSAIVPVSEMERRVEKGGVKRIDCRVMDTTRWKPNRLTGYNQSILKTALAAGQSTKVLAIVYDEHEAIMKRRMEQDVYPYWEYTADSLESLIIWGFHDLYLPKLFDKIQHTFKNLRILSIENSGRGEALELEKLEVFILHASVDGVRTEWVFPSLTHFSLGYNPYDLPLPFANQRLVALDLGRMDEIIIDEKFWENYSFIRSLSVSTRNLVIRSSPPSSHPLEHLFVHIYSELFRNPKHRINTTAQARAQILNAYRMLPNIKWFSIDCQTTLKTGFNDEEADLCERPWWSSKYLDRRSGREGEGVIWLDEKGRPIQERWHWKERTIRDWEPKLELRTQALLILGIGLRLWRAPPILLDWLLLFGLVLWLVHRGWSVYDHWRSDLQTLRASGLI